MSFICNYCNKELKTKGNFNAHLKNAKYCIKLRGEDQNTNGFNCEFCKKNYSTNQRLKDHFPKCIQYQLHLKKDTEKEKEIRIKFLEEALEESKETIKELQNSLKNIASKPTTTFNINQYNHVQHINLEKDHVQGIVNNHLSIKDICKGKIGCIDFIIDKICKDNNGNIQVWIPDPNRKNILYKDEEGDIIKDSYGFRLIQHTVPAVYNRGKEIIKMFHQTYYKKDEIGNNVLKSFDEIEYQKSIEFEEKNEKMFLLYQEINKLVDEINLFKNGYEPEKIDYYEESLRKGFEEIAHLVTYCDSAAKELSLRLPNKPKLINIQEILGDETN